MRNIKNNYISYNGKSSVDYDIIVAKNPSLTRANRKYEKVSVPGRNGDLFFLQDAYENYNETYALFVGNGTENSTPEAVTKVSEWLAEEKKAPTIEDYLNLTINGYRRLIDSYEPEVIRLAALTQGFETDNLRGLFGRPSVTFNCRPERFMEDAFEFVEVETETQSGDIVTFEGNFQSLTVSVDAVQSGNDDPSPTNVRTISGRDAVNITVSPTTDAEDGTTTNIALGQTVYGGNLDVVTGVLTITHKRVNLGTLTYTYVSDYFRTSISDKALGSTNIIADCYKTSSAQYASDLNDGEIIGNNNYNFIFIKDTRYTDGEALKTALNGHYVVYEYTNPTTVQLTPIQVQTLEQNNIWADSGDVTVVVNNPIINPTLKIARPCLKVYGSGSGTVVCNGYVINISDIPQYIYIDSDSQNCFKELSDANLNNLVSLTSGFPVLSSGNNAIYWSGGVTRVEVMPRWWNL